MPSINLHRVKITLIQVIEGIFERPLPDMSQFDKGIYKYKEGLISFKVTSDLLTIKEDLKLILNNEDKFDLEKLFYDSYDVYADSQEQVKMLLIRFWSIFFPEESWEDQTFRHDDLLIYTDKAEYENGF